MSKRDLKKYVNELTKEQLEEQILELYEKFSSVKVYYNFVFNPQEEKLLQECKLKFQVNIFQQVPNVKAKDASFRCPEVH
jgi:hypothetical protein